MAQVRYGMMIDSRKCLGCHTCSVAGKQENSVPLGVWRSWVKQVEKGRYPYLRKSFLPLLCNHCENPICVTVYPGAGLLPTPGWNRPGLSPQVHRLPLLHGGLSLRCALCQPPGEYRGEMQLV